MVVISRVAFMDSEGRHWRVEERTTPIRSLVFLAQDRVRRVRDYPADWPTLSPDELEALSWQL